MRWALARLGCVARLERLKPWATLLAFTTWLSSNYGSGGLLEEDKDAFFVTNDDVRFAVAVDVAGGDFGADA